METENMAHWDFWIRVATDHPDVFMLNEEPTWLYRQHSAARHAKRVGNKDKILKRENARKKMLKKHQKLLKKYNLESLLTIDLYK